LSARTVTAARATAELAEQDASAPGFYVDTAGSWDGSWPAIGDGDYLVSLDSDTGDGIVVVSRRYVGAVDAADARSIAVDAWEERYGCTPWVVSCRKVRP
jgi:hypothetical protein